MNLPTADNDWLRLHRQAGRIACNQQIPDLNWSVRRISFHSHSTGRGDENFAFAAFSKSNAWLLRERFLHEKSDSLKSDQDFSCKAGSRGQALAYYLKTATLTT